MAAGSHSMRRLSGYFFHCYLVSWIKKASSHLLLLMLTYSLASLLSYSSKSICLKLRSYLMIMSIWIDDGEMEKKKGAKPRWKLKAHYFIIWSYTCTLTRLVQIRITFRHLTKCIQRKEFVTSAMDFALRRKKGLTWDCCIWLRESWFVTDNFLHSSLIPISFLIVPSAERADQWCIFLQKQSSFLKDIFLIFRCTQTRMSKQQINSLENDY